MDGTDEKRDDTTPDRTEVNRDPGTLGIGDANPPRDHVPSGGGHIVPDEQTDRPGSREIHRTPGATGIDMGGGGEGTDIERP